MYIYFLLSIPVCFIKDSNENGKCCFVDFFFVCLIDTSNEIKSGKARRHGKVGFNVSGLFLSLND